MNKCITILILTILLSNFAIATNTTSSSNPINNFMQREIISDSFKFIGAPQTLTNQNLIIYLLFILIAYIIITDILNSINLFDKKWISNAISLIIVLIGLSSGQIYVFLTYATTIGFAGVFATKFASYIILGILIIYLIIRVFVKIIKRNSRTNQEKADERAAKIATLRKIQDIEATAAGMH